LERSRNSLGNLAHALKGPLNLLVQYLDQEPDASNNQQAKLQAERIRQLTERELKRARLAGQGNTTQRFDPRVELPVLVDVLARIHHKSPRCITLDIAPDISRFGDREDMLELVGNLLDNACKWAQEHVRCQLSMVAGHVQMVVEDDGAGRTAAELQQMAERGVRLDESVEGHGLGLAICKDIVKLYGGTLEFGRSEVLGGLKVTVVL
jgi:signal transduction histidine kinase